MPAKRRKTILALAAAGTLGLGAPMASATGGGHGHGHGADTETSSGIINANDNQVPIQACNNNVPVNGGAIAGQVPVNDIAGMLGIGADGNTATVSDDCDQNSKQHNN